ncbi:hypothetical protein BZA70DRAFT_77550 [Myxozyma melibiosi]|uniref:Secreted protein n=1 Tax=Myxozyma melibiosi TaxID=54550 RepID=A0ABR1F0G5_9ASCO
MLQIIRITSADLCWLALDFPLICLVTGADCTHPQPWAGCLNPVSLSCTRANWPVLSQPGRAVLSQPGRALHPLPHRPIIRVGSARLVSSLATALVPWLLHIDYLN